MNNFIKNHLEILKVNNFTYPEVELRAMLNKTSKSTPTHLTRANFFHKFLNMTTNLV